MAVHRPALLRSAQLAHQTSSAMPIHRDNLASRHPACGVHGVSCSIPSRAARGSLRRAVT